MKMMMTYQTQINSLALTVSCSRVLGEGVCPAIANILRFSMSLQILDLVLNVNELVDY